MSSTIPDIYPRIDILSTLFQLLIWISIPIGFNDLKSFSNFSWWDIQQLLLRLGGSQRPARRAAQAQGASARSGLASTWGFFRANLGILAGG